VPPFAADALVLRTYPLGETSKVVVLLTRERGKLRAVAKGVRGPRPRYRSALEPLSEVRVELFGRQGAELFRMGECELVRSAFPDGGRGPEAALALSYFAELLDAFGQEGEADDAVYRLAVAVIRAAEAGGAASVLARYLEAWLLRLNGVYPPLDRCASCGGALPAGALHYHAPAQGFACDGCRPASGPLLAAGAREALVRFLRTAPSDLGASLGAADAPLESFHQDLITRHLERPLRSQRVLRDVAASVAEAAPAPPRTRS
jgi:DNA repair protein RecO (recombination protein O)